jgi:hypothetical protein
VARIKRRLKYNKMTPGNRTKISKKEYTVIKNQKTQPIKKIRKYFELP